MPLKLAKRLQGYALQVAILGPMSTQIVPAKYEKLLKASNLAEKSSSIKHEDATTCAKSLFLRQIESKRGFHVAHGVYRAADVWRCAGWHPQQLGKQQG